MWHSWERSVGSVVISTIAIANYGRWPRSLDEWVSVALRHGLYISIGPAGTFLYGSQDIRIAFMKPQKTRRRLHNNLAHEVAEHLVRTECAAPYNYRGDSRSHHRIACFVQQYDRRQAQKRKRNRISVLEN